MKTPRRTAVLAALALLALAAPSLAVPEAARQHVDTAARALNRGDGLAAEIELKAALKNGASKSDVAAAMGEALLLRGNRIAAREWLAPGQFAKGSQAKGWMLLGQLERLDGRLPASGAAFDKALAFSPKDPLLWVEIGRLRYVGGEQLQAHDAADKALSLDPANVRALELKAQLISETQGYGEAAAYYEQALDAAPGDIGLLIGYAAALGEAGRDREMLSVARRILGQAGGEPRAWYFQAVLAARAGNNQLARAMLNRVGDRMDHVPAVLLLRGSMELEAGNANLAAQLLGRVVERQSANPRAQQLFARALYESGDYKALLTRFSALAARPDASVYLLTIMARAYEEVGDRLAAGQLLDRAAAVAPAATLAVFEPGGPGTYAGAWLANQSALGAAVPYVRSLIAAGDQAGAIRVASRFLELHPGSGAAFDLAGDAQLAGGNAAAALPLYQAAAKVRFPDTMLVRIGESADRIGQGGVMPGLVAQYLERFPGSRLALRMAATMAAASGDWKSARNLLENLRLLGGNGDVRLLADLSYAQLRSGDPKAALESASRAWLLQPSSAVAAQARGMALVELGQDFPIARQLLEQARRSGGDNALLKAARAKLK
ncbi:MAG: tetratricopeptide repeat protein [Novosphingobium sp.]|uniref:tetratricopeptide repeat protein n=1 Tax=Novosphingobium sp. TaxID=1874826 RepID=UPI0032BD83F4